VVPVALLGLAACGDPGPDHVVRKTIGPRGGLVSSHDRVLTLVLQPGALTRDVEIEVFPSDEPPPIFGPAYRVRPQLELLIDAEITYRRVLPSNPNAATLAAIRLDDYTEEMGHWEPLPRLALSPAQQWVIAVDDELSLYYGLLEDPDAAPLPGDDGDDVPPADDDGPSVTSTGGSGTDDASDGGQTTMGVDPTTGDDGPMDTSDDDGPVTTSGVDPTTDGGDEMGMDDGMVMPVCGDGMPQAGELCFGMPQSAPAGLGPADVGLGDLDGDGALDVITLDADALEVGVLLGNGNGTLGAPGVGTPVTGAPAVLEVGDFTGDGELDVVVLDIATDAVLLLEGTGTGVLADPVATATGAGVVDMVATNFDPGPTRDLAVLNAGDNTVQMLLGGGGGLVAGLTAGVGANIDDAVTSGSFNAGDTFADVLAVGAAGYDAWATNGMGTGYIGQITNAFGGGGTWAKVVAGDVDEDGNDDVVGIDTTADELVVGLSTGGAATFAFAAPLGVGVEPSDVALADLDGDGDLDAVVCNSASGDVMVLAWTGGAYVLAFTIDAGTQPSGVAVGDLDGDGVPDLVITNAGSDDVTIVLSDP
jgi:hypothetical protein